MAKTKVLVYCYIFINYIQNDSLLNKDVYIVTESIIRQFILF